MSAMKTTAEEIAALRRARNAVILAHNYERPEVQDIADFTGDSLELARKAASVEADVIVFCGVYFMAETAAILNPSKKVLIPDETAGCPMADMITGEQLRALKAQHPGAAAVCYVNSTAEVKAECDICVTSGNAERVMATFPKDREIIFVPDRHLGSHIAEKLGVSYILWPGRRARRPSGRARPGSSRMFQRGARRRRRAPLHGRHVRVRAKLLRAGVHRRYRDGHPPPPSAGEPRQEVLARRRACLPQHEEDDAREGTRLPA